MNEQANQAVIEFDEEALQEITDGVNEEVKEEVIQQISDKSPEEQRQELIETLQGTPMIEDSGKNLILTA